jgi:hypothetical protein
MHHPTWHTSTYSSDQGGNCIEITHHNNTHTIRDSKNPTGPTLTLTTTQWSTFTTRIQAGEFD